MALRVRAARNKTAFWTLTGLLDGVLALLAVQPRAVGFRAPAHALHAGAVILAHGRPPIVGPGEAERALEERALGRGAPQRAAGIAEAMRDRPRRRLAVGVVVDAGASVVVAAVRAPASTAKRCDWFRVSPAAVATTKMMVRSCRSIALRRVPRGGANASSRHSVLHRGRHGIDDARLEHHARTHRATGLNAAHAWRAACHATTARRVWRRCNNAV